MTADHYAGRVPPEEKDLTLIEGPVPVYPVLEGKIGVHVCGLGDEHGPLDGLGVGVCLGPLGCYTSTGVTCP